MQEARAAAHNVELGIKIGSFGQEVGTYGGIERKETMRIEGLTCVRAK